MTFFESSECFADSRCQVSVSVSPSGEIEEGSSVTLTCSSEASPPVQRYTWFKENETGVWQAGSGQSLHFSNFRLWNSGQYYCGVTEQAWIPELYCCDSQHERRVTRDVREPAYCFERG